MSKFIFITDYFLSSYLSLYLKQCEGCDVVVHVTNDAYKDLLGGIMPKEDTYIQHLGQGNIFVMDYQKQGKLADALRARGEYVFGGGEISDRLESDRNFAEKYLKQMGFNVPDSTSYKGHSACDKAIEYVRAHPRRYCVKQNGDNEKSLNAVGKFDDGTDIIDKLMDYKHVWVDDVDFQLQEFIDGHECGVSAIFNGKDWVKDQAGELFVINFEHKKLSEEDTGVTTGEVGTLQCRASSKSKLAHEMMKLTELLRKIEYRGLIDLNFIISKKNGKPYVLEFTNRFGYPALSMEIQAIRSKFSDMIKSVAMGTDEPIKYDPSWCVTVKVQVPPFPFEAIKNYNDAKGQRVYWLDNGKWTGKDTLLTPEKLKYLHLHEVKFNKENRHFEVTGPSGDMMDVTAMGRTVREANDLAKKRIKDCLYTSNFTYRKDIGTNERVQSAIKFMTDKGYL